MKNVKELLKDNEQVWFSIDDDENQKREFLRWAKQSGCTWREKEIDPEKDDCRIFMGIDKNLVLGYVGGHSWFQSTNSPEKINFKEFMEK